MILNFLWTTKISYFLFFRYVKIYVSTITQNENLPHFNKFFSSSFSSTANANSHMRGHNLTMKFPPDIHNYTALKGFVNCFS